MQVSLGPLDADEMNGWLRFARRVLCDLRTEPGDMDSLFAANLLGEWCAMVDSWNDVLIEGSSDRTHFVWARSLEPDKVEYLLHSLQQTLHSATVAAWVTPEDLQSHGIVTLHIMQRFIEALESEGTAHVEYVEQLRSEVSRFGALL